MLPEESDVVCQLPGVPLLFCFHHIPTFVLSSHCASRAPRVLLASACLLLSTAHGQTRQVTIPARLALPISRLASNACLRHGATATMLGLYTSLRLGWSRKCSDATSLAVIKDNGSEIFRDLIAVYAKGEELCQCYHQQLPRTCSTSCASCTPGMERLSSASSCSAPGRGERRGLRAISISWSLAHTSPEAA